jgi:hypothetical protein
VDFDGFWEFYCAYLFQRSERILFFGKIMGGCP